MTCHCARYLVFGGEIGQNLTKFDSMRGDIGKHFIAVPLPARTAKEGVVHAPSDIAQGALGPPKRSHVGRFGAAARLSSPVVLAAWDASPPRRALCGRRNALTQGALRPLRSRGKSFSGRCRPVFQPAARLYSGGISISAPIPRTRRPCCLYLGCRRAR